MAKIITLRLGAFARLPSEQTDVTPPPAKVEVRRPQPPPPPPASFRFNRPAPRVVLPSRPASASNTPLTFEVASRVLENRLYADYGRTYDIEKNIKRSEIGFIMRPKEHSDFGTLFSSVFALANLPAWKSVRLRTALLIDKCDEGKHPQNILLMKRYKWQRTGDKIMIFPRRERNEFTGATHGFSADCLTELESFAVACERCNVAVPYAFIEISVP